MPNGNFTNAQWGLFECPMGTLLNAQWGLYGIKKRARTRRETVKKRGILLLTMLVVMVMTIVYVIISIITRNGSVFAIISVTRKGQGIKYNEQNAHTEKLCIRYVERT